MVMAIQSWLERPQLSRVREAVYHGEFIAGAQLALAACKTNQINIAILAESSPSCGSKTIYDGQFNGSKISGVGVTTALLRENGIQVFNQHEISLAEDYIEQSESM